jgi:hypothetical protein
LETGEEMMLAVRSGSFWVAVVAGVASPILISNISRFLGVWGSNGVYVMALFVFLLLGLLLAYSAPMHLKLAGFIALASIAVGVFVDATLDLFLRAYDRNIWPLEIVLWWLFAPVPMILGAFVGKVFQRKKTT